MENEVKIEIKKTTQTVQYFSSFNWVKNKYYLNQKLQAKIIQTFLTNLMILEKFFYLFKVLSHIKPHNVSHLHFKVWRRSMRKPFLQRLNAFRIFLGILLFDKRFLKIFQKFSSPLFLRRKKNLFFCNNFFWMSTKVAIYKILRSHSLKIIIK